MERAAGLGTEVSLILKSEIFERAPTQSRLLMYLYRHSCERGGCATQNDIATEGLGRTEFDETTDSSVRVQVSRLRKSLADYYLSNTPHDGLCVYVKRGEYRLRSARLEIAYPELAAHAKNGSATAPATDMQAAADVVLTSDLPNARDGARPLVSAELEPKHASRSSDAPIATLQTTSSGGRTLVPYRKPFLFAAAIAALFGVILFLGQLQTPAEASLRGTALQAPTIGLEVESSGSLSAVGGAESLTRAVQSDLDTLLQKSMISRVLPDQSRVERDYHLNVQIRENRNDIVLAFVSLRNRQGEVLSETSLSTPADLNDIREVIFDEVVSLVSPAGVISRDLVEQIPQDPRNGFECFLATENARAVGEGSGDTLSYCLQNFSDDAFWPFFAARQAFVDIQTKIVAGKTVGSRSPEWNKIAAILAKSPDNPYANTIAAKLLIAEGRCDTARGYAIEGFSRGRSYPALELSILVDAYGCPNVEDSRPVWDRRIKRIYAANGEPHALLETYLLLGAIVSNQTELIDDSWGSAFTVREETPLDDLNEALQRAIAGRARPRDFGVIERGVPAVIFKQETREMIYAKLGEKRPRSV